MRTTFTNDVETLVLPALEIDQGNGRRIYSFAVDGKLLPRFTTISRIKRGQDADIQGYQRPEVRSHISEIKAYLESERPLLPNAIVVAFDSRVTFLADSSPANSRFSRTGHLRIPIEENLPEELKPGWIVDGQQRAAAIREARIESFPISVNAFIAKDYKEQREQFILVNSTKPLPKGLIYELLPTTDTQLPTMLEKRRFPALLSDRLNHDEDSPFLGLIATPTNPGGLVKDNSILKMLENSLSDGALYLFRNPSSGTGDTDAMLMVLKNFWNAVREVFSESWGQSPRKSRLMHGAGIVSLGYIMDAITDRFRREGIPCRERYEEELLGLKPYTRWCEGYWNFGPGQERKWNELQNTSKDLQMLANYLMHIYRQQQMKI